MENISSKLLVCPHCGAKKRVGKSSTSWINLPYTFWSDSRIDCEGWFEPAHIQQCPKCGKFFVISQKTVLQDEDLPCTETGQLPYPILKKAIEELAGDDFAEEWARLEIFWTYNRMCQNSEDIPEKEIAYNRANMQWLIDYYTIHSTRFNHILFELNRLMGNREICEQMIEALTFEEYVRQRNERYREKGIESKLGEDAIRDLYNSQIKQLKFALTQPPKTFVISKH